MTVKKKVDRRTQRTRHQLGRALVGLVEEKRFDDITVQEVIDRADVGRSTFYTHFRDKEDLFRKDWEKFLDFLAQQIDWDKAGKGSFMPIAFLFSHLQDAQTFYKGLVRSQKTDAVFKSGAEYLSLQVEAALGRHVKHKPAIPIPILSNYLVNEMFALLRWWLDQRMPYSPQRMDEIFHELVNPTIQAALQDPALHKK
jgi:AcrR family transcriptional regulator